MIQIITKYKINGQEKHQLKGLTLSQRAQKSFSKDATAVQQAFHQKYMSSRRQCTILNKLKSKLNVFNSSAPSSSSRTAAQGKM